MATTAIQMDTMPNAETRSRSQSTLTRVFKPDPNEENYGRVSTFSQEGCLSTMVKLQHPGHQEDPPLKYHPLWSFSFMIKLLQVFVTIVCAGLYTKGVLLVKGSVTSQMFPNIVFASYMLITPVILLSYVLGQKMPELLIRIFNILGAILFLVAGIISVIEWTVRSKQAVYEAEIKTEAAEDDDEREGDCVDMDTLDPKLLPMLLAVGVLSIFNFAIYLCDVVFSIKRTLSYL